MLVATGRFDGAGGGEDFRRKANGVDQQGRSSRSSLTTLVDGYIRGRRARSEINALTAKNQRYTLGTFARSYGARPVERMGRTDVERWLGEASFTPSAQRTRLSTVRNFCRWLVREGRLRRDPTAGIAHVRQPRTVPRVLERSAVASLLDFCPDARGRLIVLLMVQLGLRCVEVSRLELGDVADRHLKVTGKGGHERVLPIVGEVRDALADYLAVRGGAAGPLIQSYQHPGRGLARTTISLYVNEWIGAARLKQFRYDGRSAHALRRTCATDMIDSGADVLDVQEALGHAQLATVLRYVRYRTDRLEQAMDGRRYRLGDVG